MSTFSKWTPSDAALHNARVSKRNAPEESVAGVSREADLHDDIYSECRRRGWIALHSAMSERTTRNKGEWDFTILGSVRETWTDGTGESWSPRVWFIEIKSATGKLRTEQLAMIAHARALGHTVHVIRSFADFLGIISE